MPFDPAGRFVRPGNFQADKLDGRYVEAIRFDQELDDIADGLSKIRAVSANPVVTFNPLYYTRTQHDASLAKKQDALGFSPIDEMRIGVPGGVVPLNANNQIDTHYLPTVYGGGTSGTTTSGPVTAQTITQALGFTPFSSGGSLPQAQVTGLPAALQAKQDNLGFTPAPAAHSHIVGDIPGLQNQLDAMVTVSISQAEQNTTFPKGHTILVQADKSGANYGTGSYKNALKTIYTGATGSATDPGSYTTAPVGSILTGQWLCRGTVGDISQYQRVA